MCSHYQALRDRERYRRHFGVDAPESMEKFDLWPQSMGTFIRRHPHADVGDEAVPERESVTAMFGLVPHWAEDTKIARRTYNARTETVAVKPSFRDAWRRARHCIIPADAFYEPDWRSGRATPTRIARADGKPMGIAGLWDSWRAPTGEMLSSYCMLTINADHHELMRHFHKPTDEKRMVVILPDDAYDAWLAASAEQSAAFLRDDPATELVATQ